VQDALVSITVFLSIQTGFDISCELANLEQNDHFSTLKVLISRKIFLGNVCQFSQGKNAVDLT
jgi:hypothetical protein